MAKKESIGPMKRVSNTLMSIDLFGETATFQIEGKSKYNSFCGTVLSFGIFVTILAYGINKFNVMMNHGDTAHQSFINSNEISFLKNFTYAETGFNFAFGLVRFKEVTPKIIEFDERYVQIYAGTVEV